MPLATLIALTNLENCVFLIKADQGPQIDAETTGILDVITPQSSQSIEG
jgi:hypothetical protein